MPMVLRPLAAVVRALGASTTRSHHDLPDGADGGLWANLGRVGNGLHGGIGGAHVMGLSSTMAGSNPACRGPLSPPVVRASNARFLHSAAAAAVKICDVCHAVVFRNAILMAPNAAYDLT